MITRSASGSGLHIEAKRCETKHVGKQPKQGAERAERMTELIRMRREMKEAVADENYERASQLRDEIRRIEQEGTA